MESRKKYCRLAKMVNYMNFKENLDEKVKTLEEIIYRYLPVEEGYQKTVISAMNYSVQAGGKRLRPMLMAEVYRLYGGTEKAIEPFLAAIELIHTYSLVHDDLPAMDNDEYRRGRKTTHVVYGEAMAILAGDALLNYAFETAAKAFDLAADLKDYERIAKAMQILTKKAGIYGMVGGQVADVEAEKKGSQVTEELLLYIHENKTAALIQSSMMIGAALAGADDETLKRLEKCAYNIGIAFQIQDDVLDVIGSEEVLGKPIGSDAKNEKTTYVTQHGLEASREQVKVLSEEAISILHDNENTNPFLEELVRQLIYREK